MIDNTYRSTSSGINKRSKKMKLRYKFGKPRVEDFIALFKTTGWTFFPPKTFNKVLDGTYCQVCVYDGKRLVGTARVLSDGAAYAWINDMIVHPEYQRHGIGSKIMKMIIKYLRERKIPNLGLFCAPGAKKFYISLGFKERPSHAPGMYKDFFSAYRSL